MRPGGPLTLFLIGGPTSNGESGAVPFPGLPLLSSGARETGAANNAEATGMAGRSGGHRPPLQAARGTTTLPSAGKSRTGSRCALRPVGRKFCQGAAVSNWCCPLQNTAPTPTGRLKADRRHPADLPGLGPLRSVPAMNRRAIFSRAAVAPQTLRFSSSFGISALIPVSPQKAKSADSCLSAL